MANNNALKRRYPSKTLGPISDLERHLPEDWWRTLFNAIYLKTDGDVVENESNTLQDIDLFLKHTNLTQQQRILDLCCGQGRHSIELSSRGYVETIGLDRSRYLIRLARKRAARAGVTVTFKEGDARKFRMKEASMDAVALFGNSFGYFERKEDDLRVLQAVLRVMKPEGYLFMDITEGNWMRENFERRSWEWIDQDHFVCRERALAKDTHRLITREVVTHVERGVIADQFYAERLYKKEEITEILGYAGFDAIEIIPSPPTQSDRQQDLGMMEHRLILIARKPKKIFHAVRTDPLYPSVTVLLGDPSLPDIVKLKGQFNSEDIATVNTMKEALLSLSEYSFSYMDRHQGLSTALQEKPPAFVFNLCDEGYMNDAFKELHVPALLDIHGIPYTGAGPACLAWCYNKALVRSTAQDLDIPVPLESYFSPDDQAATIASVFPALLKPNFGDSSQGITKQAVVYTKEEFIDYLEYLRSEFPKRPILIQEFLDGPEYSVGIIGNPGLGITVLPILEVDYSHLDSGLPKILGYESKWVPDSPYWTQIKYKEASISSESGRVLSDYSLRLFEYLECRDYARFDFRADSNGVIKLLEVNPNPGWCWDGKMNYMAGFAGLSYTDMLRMIIEAGQERYGISL